MAVCLSSGVSANESLQSKSCCSTKVSGLQRNRQQNNLEVPFAPPLPSPTPASAPTGSPAPAAAAAPPEPPQSRLLSPSPLSFKREPQGPPPVLSPSLLRAPPHFYPPHPHSQQDSCIPVGVPQPHTRPIIRHQVHHPLQYSLHDIR